MRVQRALWVRPCPIESKRNRRTVSVGWQIQEPISARIFWHLEQELVNVLKSSCSDFTPFLTFPQEWPGWGSRSGPLEVMEWGRSALDTSVQLSHWTVQHQPWPLGQWRNHKPCQIQWLQKWHGKKKKGKKSGMESLFWRKQLRVTKAEVSNLERVYANLGLVPRDRQETRQRPWETLWALGAFPDSAGHLLWRPLFWPCHFWPPEHFCSEFCSFIHPEYGPFRWEEFNFTRSLIPLFQLFSFLECTNRALMPWNQLSPGEVCYSSHE